MNELRLFISSTFRDLQEEREHLVKKIFPEIHALCRERGVTFTEVDLRWGLTNEEVVLGRVIRTCLEEVDRCHPFFLGLLGNTYGWVPDVHDVFMDADLLNRFPWVEHAALEGRSLTEMEFIEGVFDPPTGRAPHGSFYRRLGNLQTSDDPGKLHALVERVRSTSLPYHEFSDPEELGRFVRNDLLATIDLLWPAVNAPTPIETERNAHEAFAQSRVRGYIPREEFVEVFDRWREHGATPLAVIGASGMGKSSLVATLVDRFRSRHPNAFVVEHYVGVSDPSTTIVGTVRRIAEEIADRFGLLGELPDDPLEVESNFGDWLFRLDHLVGKAGMSAFIVIDAINQLEERGQTMLWLPEIVPSALRLLLSTTPGEAETAMKSRGWQCLDVTPLHNERLRRSIVVRYLGEFHKGIDPAQLHRLTSDEKAASPLYLRVVTEELRLHGLHETVAEVVTRFVEAADIGEVFQRVLERMELDFGRDTVERVLSSIWCSRSGLAEAELIDIAEVNRLTLSRMLFALDYHLLHRNGLLDFFHDYLREAVEKRYLADESVRKSYHRRIARHFSEAPFDERRRDEEPWQWREAGEMERLRGCLTMRDMFDMLVTEDMQYELLAYWRSIGEQCDFLNDYEQAGWARDDAKRDARAHVDTLARLASLCQAASRLGDAVALRRRALEASIRAGGASDWEVARLYALLGGAEYSNAQFTDAYSHFELAASTYRRLGTSYAIELVDCLEGMAAVMLEKGDTKAALEMMGQAHEITASDVHVSQSRSLNQLANLAATHATAGHVHEAEQLLNRIVDGYSALYGPRHPKTLSARGNLAAAHHLRKDYAGVKSLLTDVIADLRSTLGLHSQLASALYTLGNTMMALRDYQSALIYLQEARQIQMKLIGPEHIQTLDTETNIAGAYIGIGNPMLAAQILAEIIPHKVAIRGWNHPLTRRNVDTFRRAIEELGLDIKPVAADDDKALTERTYETLLSIWKKQQDRATQ